MVRIMDHSTILKKHRLKCEDIMQLEEWGMSKEAAVAYFKYSSGRSKITKISVYTVLDPTNIRTSYIPNKK
jgi:hypothetical protein